MKKEKIMCKICGVEVKNSLGLSSHLHRKHSISVKDYYDKYNKLENEDKCVICGKSTKFISYDVGYGRVCGYKCSYQDPIRREKLKIIATENAKERIAKTKATNLKKFGVECTLQLPEVRELTKKSNWTSEAREKRINTNIEKWGVENPAQSKTVQEKMQDTTFKKYGAKNVFASDYGKEKIKETNLREHGYENPFYDENVQKNIQSKIKDKFGGMGAASHIIKEKMKQTNLDRYGVENCFNLPYVQSNECWQKRSQTARKNGNHSFYEDYFETQLISFGYIKDKTYKTQYKDDRYPYHCDFYLVEEDLFVEIHGTWFHGGHWFNVLNTLDNKKLNLWKSKAQGSNQYERAIKSWVEIDPIKKNIARQNNLNYVVLWTLQDINAWFAKGRPIRKDWSTYIKKSNTYKITFNNNTYMIVDNNFIISIKNIQNNKLYTISIDVYNQININDDYIGSVNDLIINNIEEYNNIENKLLEVVYLEE